MLSRRVLDAMERADAAPSPEALTEAIGGFLGGLGFRMFASALIVPGANGDAVDVAWLSNADRAWFEHYTREGYERDDYGIQRHARDPGTRPFLIGIDHADKLSDLTAPQRRFYEHAGEAGLTAGYVLPTVTRLGAATYPSGYSLWADGGGDALAGITRAHGAEIAAFLLTVQQRLLPALGEQPPRSRLLSDRERECLHWLAAGERPDAIAWRLAIAEVTVRRHLASARDKLGARTMPQAVARAVVSGLIRP